MKYLSHIYSGAFQKCTNCSSKIALEYLQALVYIRFSTWEKLISRIKISDDKIVDFEDVKA